MTTTSHAATLDDKRESASGTGGVTLRAVAERLLETILQVPYRSNRLWSIFLSGVSHRNTTAGETPPR